jgi:hypothetical protein
MVAAAALNDSNVVRGTAKNLTLGRHRAGSDF